MDAKLADPIIILQTMLHLHLLIITLLLAMHIGTRGGLAVCISACDDDGNAADTSVSYACMHLFVTFSDTPSKIISMIG